MIPPDGGSPRALILFGPPGSGKGTQARLLRECLRFPHISTGDMLRDHIDLGDAIGSEVHATMRLGGLVPNEVVNRLVEERIALPDAARGFILDGYPRTLEQAAEMRGVLDARGIRPVVVHLKVDYNKVVARLSGRRQCPVCGTLYSSTSNPPRVPGFCDLEGAALAIREDDSEPVIRRRLEEYEALTKPLLEFFAVLGVPVHQVDGSLGSPEQIAEKVCELVADFARVPTGRR